MSHPSLSQMEQEQEFDSRKDSHSAKFKLTPGIFLKLTFRELRDLKLSGLHPFNNVVLIH